MSSNFADILRWAQTSLPSLSIAGDENFGGDPLVKRFYDFAVEGKMRPTLLVAWQGPPEPSFLTTPYGPVVIRSERLDPLLIEYLHLKALAPTSPLAIDLIDRAVLRWIAEFSLGQGNALATAWATIAANSPILRISQWPMYGFRDELLGSIHAFTRAAVQCFTLGHEIGHSVQAAPASWTLSTVIDGLSLMDHIEHDFSEFGVPQYRQQRLISLMEKSDVTNLVLEIGADITGLALTTEFLYQNFDCDWAKALEATLNAVEALHFLQALLRSTYILETQPQDAFEDADWVYRTQTSIRARCVMRHAGFFLARCSLQPGEELTAERVNECVPIIDAMFVGSVPFRSDLNRRALALTDEVRHNIEPTAKLSEQDLFSAYTRLLFDDQSARLDLSYLGWAVGYQGGTSFEKLLNWMFERRNRVRGS